MATPKKTTTKTAIGKATSKIVKKVATKKAVTKKPAIGKVVKKATVAKTATKAKPAAKPEALKRAAFSGNCNHLKFGKDINAKTLEGYNKSIFGIEFKLEGIEHTDSHYWTAFIVNTKTKKRSEKRTRLDYLFNYLRIPKGLSTDSVIEKVNTCITKAEKALATA